ncbi:MAG: HesA/MoeB/ThiF family protein [Bacteroidaceae bacterium]|nr:HesA/MoeB/ThiF family protein [Bacteroidaceae bacterium]
MTTEQQQRYARHLVLDGFGAEGQERMLTSRVLIVGAGGLGSPIALYLAAAGVGTIGIIDGDVVSLSNLQRQIIHSTAGVDCPKAMSAADRIHSLNPEVRVDTFPTFLTRQNASDIISRFDYVIDGTDHFAPKYLINDTCVQLGKPFTMGGISRYQGQVMTHVPGSACYRCLFDEPVVSGDTDSCEATGVLGSIAGICGTLMATECIKYFVGVGELLTDALLTFDALTMQFHTMRFQRNPECRVCGQCPSIDSTYNIY